MARWRDLKHKKQKNYIDRTISPVEEGLKPSSLARRFKAFLTDSFLVNTPITYIVIYFILDGGQDFAQHRIFGWSLILGVTAFIIVFFWYVKKQTPGMKAYEQKIVNNKGERISFIQGLIRFLATTFAICSVFLTFVAFFRKDKRTFQDIISQTTIIDEK